MNSFITWIRRWVAARPCFVRAYCVFALLAAPPVIAAAGLCEVFSEYWPGFWREIKEVWRTRKLDAS